MTDTVKTDDIISHMLLNQAITVEDTFDANVFMLRAPITIGLDDFVKNEIEDISQSDRKKDKLTVILETGGGFIEVAERIHKVFRHHFQIVEFVIPNFAYSAGTVLALSGDEIYMDYYSVLGPIDPQVTNQDGKMVPGLGYLAKFNDLITKSDISQQEIEFLIRKFDPAELFSLEQAVAHSKSLIESWLPKYKFKDWDKGHDEKKQRASDIATTLGDPEKWKSHSRGIFREDLEADDIKLKIKDLTNSELSSSKYAIMQYYDLFVDYCAKIGTRHAIHSINGLTPLGR